MLRFAVITNSVANKLLVMIVGRSIYSDVQGVCVLEIAADYRARNKAH